MDSSMLQKLMASGGGGGQQDSHAAKYRGNSGRMPSSANSADQQQQDQGSGYGDFVKKLLESRRGRVGDSNLAGEPTLSYDPRGLS